MDFAPQMDVWAMIRAATPTVRWVMALLAAMSVLSWAVILHKSLTLLPASRASRTALSAVLAGLSGHEDIRNVLDAAARRRRAPLAGSASAASSLIVAGGAGMSNSERCRDAVRAASLAGVQAMRGLERGVGVLAACSGAAPFIGLFGTVWGVMHAFHALGQVQTAALALVGPGIAEALVATALGLAVAVPANVAFNVATSLLDGLEADQEAFEKALALRLEAAGRPSGEA